MANNVKRMIKEDGIVLEKIFKPATAEFKSSSGEVVPAQPDRYILKCVSGEDFNEQNGFIQSTVLEYKTNEIVFDKARCYSPVLVKYEVSNYGAKAMEVELKEIKKENVKV